MRHRILIVDDEEIVRMALGETLRREGYEVLSAANGFEAMELLDQNSFSVILTDLQMPQMTGLDFLARVKKIQPEALRVVITAILSVSTVIEAINKGEIYRIIIKPWLREELLAVVQSAVQRYEFTCRQPASGPPSSVSGPPLNPPIRSLDDRLAELENLNRQLAQTNVEAAQNLRCAVHLGVRILEVAHPVMGVQARRAGEICRAIAEANQLSAHDRLGLEVGAWLHDVGLLGLGQSLIERWLLSPEQLMEAEAALIRQHPLRGQEWAAFGPPLASVGAVIRGHHERFDGTGFPDRLRGDGIPWLSRLLAVVTAFVESNLNTDAALEEIKRGSGKAFDPQAVHCFLKGWP